jgi:hypothetical protein
MFRSVTVAQKTADAGSVAEALVYYGKTDLVVRGGTLMPIVRAFGFHALMRAIEMGLIQLTYEVAGHVVITNKNPFEVHGFAIAGQTASKGKGTMSAAEQIELHFIRELGRSSETRAQARLLGQHVKERIQIESVLHAIQRQIVDKPYLENCIRETLRALVPEYAVPNDLGLDTFDTGQGFVILTNLNFEEINRIYHRRVPVEHSSLNMADLLVRMLDAEKELDFAGKCDDDLWVDEADSAILRLRTNSLVNCAVAAREHIDYFQHVEFEGRAFRAAINSGERSISDLLDLLEQDDARKFKDWLSKQTPTGALLKEYDRAVFSERGWTARLPFRTSKLMIFAGIGAALGYAEGMLGLGAAAGAAASYVTNLAVGASDEGLTAKLANGWKPNQFIEGAATRFVRGSKIADCWW